MNQFIKDACAFAAMLSFLTTFWMWAEIASYLVLLSRVQ